MLDNPMGLIGPLLLCIALTLAMLGLVKAGYFKREFRAFSERFRLYKAVVALDQYRPVLVRAGDRLSSLVLPRTLPEMVLVVVPNPASIEACVIYISKLSRGRHRVEIHIPGESHDQRVTMELSLEDGVIHQASFYPDGRLPLLERLRAGDFINHLKSLMHDGTRPRTGWVDLGDS